MAEHVALCRSGLGPGQALGERGGRRRRGLGLCEPVCERLALGRRGFGSRELLAHRIALRRGRLGASDPLAQSVALAPQHLGLGARVVRLGAQPPQLALERAQLQLQRHEPAVVDHGGFGLGDDRHVRCRDGFVRHLGCLALDRGDRPVRLQRVELPLRLSRQTVGRCPHLGHERLDALGGAAEEPRPHRRRDESERLGEALRCRPRDAAQEESAGLVARPERHRPVVAGPHARDLVAPLDDPAARERLGRVLGHAGERALDADRHGAEHDAGERAPAALDGAVPDRGERGRGRGPRANEVEKRGDERRRLARLREPGGRLGHRADVEAHRIPHRARSLLPAIRSRMARGV